MSFSLKAKKTHLQLQGGLTLIEMMIALVLGLVVTAITITTFLTTVRSNVESMKMIRLNQELRGAMTLMVDEIKRTGYSADSSTNFITFFDRVNTSCLLYSYDLNGNGIRDSSEHFGFRLETNEIKWATNASSATCDDFGQSITDADIAKITILNFDITGSVNTEGATGSDAFSATEGVSIYEVTITLTGTTDLASSSDANDPSRTISETIRIRNEAPK